MPKKYTFQLRAGETLALELNDIRDELGAVVASATGWTGKMQLRANAVATPILTIAGVVDSAVMRFQATTAGVPVGVYSFDVYLRSPGGFVSYPVEGEIVLRAAVTQP